MRFEVNTSGGRKYSGEIKDFKTLDEVMNQLVSSIDSGKRFIKVGQHALRIDLIEAIREAGK